MTSGLTHRDCSTTPGPDWRRPGEDLPVKGVLLVEDDEAVRRGLADTLRSEGHTVVAARDGQEALTVMARWRPALVILDLKLPVKSGWDVIEVMKSHPSLEKVPVFLITGAGTGDLPLGYPVFHKPFNLEALFRAVRVYTKS